MKILIKKTLIAMLSVALMLPSVEALAQSQLSGKVIDAGGNPVAGAAVIVEGTSNGVSTGLDGSFTIRAAEGAPIVVSILGYQDARVKLKDGMTVKLMEDSTLLEETVVVGYGSVKKIDLTGSVGSVSNESLVRGGLADAVGAMQGTLPGVQIQRSNSKPGGEYNILIRGLNTISGSTSPLVVVDGVQGASLSSINPDDIERIDILKDASSTAIYGSRATNGVVLVTTKRGKAGDVKIDYSGYVGVRQYTNMPEMMSGDEYVQIAREAKRNKTTYKYAPDSEIFTASELKAIQDHNYFDWVDAISHPAAMTNHTLSASGGSEKATYSLSTGYYFEDGMVDPQEYSRYNVRAAIDVKPVDYLKFGVNMYGTYSLRNTGNSDLLQDAVRLRPTYHPTNLVTGEDEWAYSNGQYNALVTQQNETNRTKTYNMFGNAFLEILPLEGLSLKTTFSPNIRIAEIGQYRGRYTKANKGTNDATSNYAKNSTTDWVWDNQVVYRKEIGVHRFDVSGIFSMAQNEYEALRGVGNGLSYNSLWYNLKGGAKENSATSGYSKYSLMSYMFRANYIYADKYYLSASVRYDGSSKLASGHKWGAFPSVALAWRVTQEDFMRNLSWVNNLKLRLSYGQTGNDNVSPYQTQGSISNVLYYTFGNSTNTAYVPNNLRNLDLGWERTSEVNVGVDFGFLKDRISGSVDYYNRLTSDLIMNKTIPSTTGYTSVKANVGSVRNSGVEVLLNTENIRTSDFSWVTQLNFAYNRNEIVDLQFKEDLSTYGESLKGMEGDYKNLWIIGQPIDINYSLMTVGIWQLDEATEAAKYGCTPGQYKPLDLNKDGKITDEDRVINGKHTPDWTGGMTNTFRYKNFDLSFQMSFQSGAKTRNQFYVSYALEGNTQNFNNLKGDYWTPENPSNERHQPSNAGIYANYRSATWGNNENKATSSHRLSKTDFVKFNYASLGYTFDKRFLGKVKLSNLRVYATVQNPYIWCDRFCFNPEQMTTSINTTDFMTCNLIFGVNVGF